MDTHPPTARVHLGEGVWLTLRAARLDGRAAQASDRDIVVTIEETTPPERMSLVRPLPRG